MVHFYLLQPSLGCIGYEVEEKNIRPLMVLFSTLYGKINIDPAAERNSKKENKENRKPQPTAKILASEHES